MIKKSTNVVEMGGGGEEGGADLHSLRNIHVHGNQNTKLTNQTPVVQRLVNTIHQPSCSKAG